LIFKNKKLNPLNSNFNCFDFQQHQNSLKQLWSCKQISCLFFDFQRLTVYIFMFAKLSIHLILNSFGHNQ
jgi:hypothetical protein